MDFLIYLPPLTSFSAYLLALRHVRQGTFHPEPISRGLFVFVTLLGLVLLLQSNPDQASILLACGLLSGSFFLFLLSVKAERVVINRQDVVAMLGATTCLLVWFFSGSAFLVLLALLATDAFAALPTVLRTWGNPFFEDVWFWTLLFLGSLLSLFVLLAGNSFQLSSLIYIVYFASSQLFMSGIIPVRRFELLPVWVKNK